jgi:hypothetical protein
MARLDGKLSPTTNKEESSVTKKVATLSKPSPNQNHDPTHDEVFGMDFKNISPAHGRGPLQISTSHEYHLGNQLQANKLHEIIHMVENTPPTTPYKSPRLEEDCNPHNAKRGKLELEEFTTASSPSKQQEYGWCHMRIPQRLSPHEHLDMVLGHYLHFTQLLKHQKENQETMKSSKNLSMKVITRVDLMNF